jgi:hypothetical protein
MSGWFYNEFSGVLNRVPTALEAPYRIPGTGWRELKIGYNSSRNQAVIDAKKEYPGSASPGGSLAGNAAHDAAKDIFHGLNLSEILRRIAEILLGLVLLGVGIARMTGAENAISKAAKTAGKAAMFA